MNGKEILITVDIISNEKKLEQEVVFQALEKALGVAARKDFGKMDLVAVIDRDTGDYIINKQITVVDDNEENFETEKNLYEDQAEEKYGKNFTTGDVITEFVSDKPLSRIAAQVFKQNIKENIRKAQKDLWQKEYYNKEGESILVTVKKFSSGDVIVAIDEEVEGILPQKELIGFERFSLGQKIVVVLKEVVENYKGQQLVFTRKGENFIKAVMKKEIPDVNDENVEIVAVSRKDTMKTKVVVKSLVPHLDPVRECLGHKGSRIKNVSAQANNEIIEVYEYENDLVDYIISLMKPHELISFYMEEKTGNIFISVADENVERARGRESVNEELISKIIGKEFKILTEEELSNIESESLSGAMELFIDKLNVDEELAEILVMEGFDSLEAVYYVPVEEMLEIEGFDEELISALKEAAKNNLETEKEQNFLELVNLGFEDKKDCQVLYDNEVKSIEDVAELSVFELQDIIDISEEEAGKIIMKARKNW